MVDRNTELTVDDCRQMFAEFAHTTASRAPLYARLSAAIANDEQVAALLLEAPVTQRQPVLLFACLHALLLARPSHELARWFPNLTAVPADDEEDPMPALRRLCAEEADEVATMLATRATQTNEIGRCALFLPVFGLLAHEVGGPLAHVDVGTSAGLNLLLPHHRYRYEPGGEVGAVDTPVTLTCGTRGDVPVPTTMPDVAAAVGLDRSPIDVTDDDAVRWLEACVWPDQVDRFQRLRAAIALAREVGVDVRRGDAVMHTPAIVDEVSAMGHPVVTNSWVLNYLTGDQRRSYVAMLDGLGAQRDVSWVYLESPWLTPELPGPVGEREVERSVLVLVRWRGGVRHVDHLADAHPHGYWLHWVGAGVENRSTVGPLVG